MSRNATIALGMCLLLCAAGIAVVGNIPWMDPQWLAGANLETAQAVAIGIDTSGSITRARLRQQIKKASDVADWLAVNNPGVSLQVFTFNADIAVIWPAAAATAPLGPGNVAAVKAAIAGIAASSNLTWISGAIDHACSVTDPRDPTGARPGPGTGTLFLLTDGKPTTHVRNGPWNAPAADAAARGSARNFQANCSTLAILGIDVSVEDEAYLREIASEGAYLYVCTSRIAFSMRQDEDSEIFTMNWDGSDLENITGTPGLDEYWPEWSPDGTRLAFIGCEADICDPNREQTSLFAIDDDGANRASLTEELLDRAEWSPKWSPDGQSILFAASPGHPLADSFTHEGYGLCGEGFVLDLGSGDLQQLTEGFLLDEFTLLDCCGNATWAPDGERFAHVLLPRLSEDAVDHGALVVVVHADASRLEEWVDLSGAAGQSVGVPDLAWCEDGLHVAFLTTADSAPNESVLWTLLIEEGEVTAMSQCTVPGEAPHVAVTWSTDARRLAFRTVDRSEGRPAVYVAELDGTDVVGLTNVSDDLSSVIFSCTQPSWSSDGRMLAFVLRAIDETAQEDWFGLAVVSADGEYQRLTVKGLVSWYDWQPMGSHGD